MCFDNLLKQAIHSLGSFLRYLIANGVSAAFGQFSGLQLNTPYLGSLANEKQLNHRVQLMIVLDICARVDNPWYNHLFEFGSTYGFRRPDRI